MPDEHNSLPHTIFMIRFNNILPFTFILPTGIFPSKLSIIIMCAFCMSQVHTTCPAQLILTDLIADDFKYFVKDAIQIMRLLITPVPKYSTRMQRHLLRYLQSTLLLKWERARFTSTQNKWNQNFTDYTLIFWYFNVRFWTVASISPTTTVLMN
jgi:hypothetical protein